MLPVLLQDKSRLQEIFDLRVLAWENSDHGHLINRDIFPRGWKDNFDEDGHHWVIFNKDQQIIASMRINLFESINQINNCADIKQENTGITGQFAYWSRLVVHPDYRGLRLSISMDNACIAYAKSKEVSIVGIADGRRIAKLNEYGFETLFKIDDRLTSNTNSENICDFMVLKYVE